jgi:serine/threonine-protein kinase
VGEVALPGETEAVSYIAMELVRGEPLRAYVGDAEVAAPRKLRWLTEVARALEVAHREGLIHRDVKPENVMIQPDDSVKVLDFGIAKLADLPADYRTTTDAQVVPTVTADGVRMGTPAYMAPEQMLGDALDVRADQFAWGVLAYELLAGRLPWGDELDAVKLIAAILSKPAPALDDVKLGLPAGTSAVVARALAKSRRDRFGTMSDLIAALRDAAEGRPTVVSGPVKTEAAAAPVEPPATPAQDAKPPSRRARWRVAALASAIAIAAVALGTRWVPHRATSPAAPPRCSTNAQCVEQHGGAPFLCKKDDGVCVSLASEDCTVHAERDDLASEDTVWFGGLVPRKVQPWKAMGDGDANGVELARLDFAATTGSKGAQATLGKIRRFGVVSCDDTDNAERAVRHLVDDVHVPAIIGFYSAPELIDVVPILAKGEVLAVVSMTNNPVLTTLPTREGGPRMVWRTTNSNAQAADAVGVLVPELLEKELRAIPGAVTKQRPLRVALVRAKARAQWLVSDAIFAKLRFNGRSAVENGSDYREIVFDAGAQDGGAATVVADLVAFAPHVVIFDGGAAVAKHVVFPVEEAWQAGVPYRPRWVALTALPVEVFAFVGTNAERRRRFWALTNTSAFETNARFVQHYNEAFSPPVTRSTAPNASYDAFYLLAFASWTIDGPVTGPALARAFARLVPPGTPLQVGTSHIFDAFAALRRGEKLDLQGATGPLDFDLATGEARVDQDILCVGVDDHGVAADSISSGLVFDSATQTLRGAIHCP